MAVVLTNSTPTDEMTSKLMYRETGERDCTLHHMIQALGYDSTMVQVETFEAICILCE